MGRHVNETAINDAIKQALENAAAMEYLRSISTRADSIAPVIHTPDIWSAFPESNKGWRDISF